MSDMPIADRTLFRGGPPERLQRLGALIRDKRPHTLRRSLVVVALIWLPLAVLSGIHGDLVGRGSWNSFLTDFGAQTRFLIVPPLLILAESLCWPRLGALAAEFLESGLIRPSDYPRYREATASTRRLMNSTAAEIITLLVAYALALTLFLSHPVRELPGWHGFHGATGFAFSPAGWWGMLVSLPLLLLLELGWIWRLCLWTRFLWLMNRLDLRLVAAHPDHSAGLRFLGYSLRAFLPIAFVFGVVVAGPVLNQVVYLGQPPMQFKYLIGGTAVLAVLALAGPLLIFVFRLIEVQRQGMLTYGMLAARMGEQFEDKWLSSGTVLGREALSASDFSSTTDLYSIVANVYAMEIVPVDLKNLLLLFAAAALPFAPVALLSAPLDVILDKIAGLFL
jgi:hypothetical protein